MSMSYLYVISEKGTDNYKIGVTKNRTDGRNGRRGQLQTGNPRDLTVLYEFSAHDRYAAEKHIENKLERFMIEGGGDEWYEFETLDNLHQVINGMVRAGELALVSEYEGDVDYINVVTNLIGKWVLRIGLIASAIVVILYLLWNGTLA